MFQSTLISDDTLPNCNDTNIVSVC